MRKFTTLKVSPIFKIFLDLLFALAILIFFTSTLLFADTCAEFGRLRAEFYRLLGNSKPPSKFNCHLLNSDRLRLEFKLYLKNIVSLNEVALEDKIFKLLKFIPVDFDQWRCQYNLPTSFYHGKKRAFYIDDLFPQNSDEALFLLVSELLERRYKLSPIDRFWSQSFDRSLALAALRGGLVAVLGENQPVADIFKNHQAYFESRSLPKKDELEDNSFGGGDKQSQCEAGEGYDRLLNFPIDFGRLYLLRKFEAGGLNSIFDLLKNPPSTSAEIFSYVYSVSIRKELFQVAPLAEEVKIFDTVWRKVYKTNLGQFFIRSLLGVHLTDAEAILASKGWRGDLAELYQRVPLKHGQRVENLLIWQVKFNNQQSALRAYGLLVKFIERIFRVQLSPESRLSYATIGGVKLILGLSDTSVIKLIVS
ncbi:MAG TPA: hypothetical protein PKD37_08155 [Oligoflexia bacterium]|nr:hypothetical protein [Oligoflexia bacterium]HMP27936.1 hypothetical protein [Oligoflexia bacterium]